MGAMHSDNGQDCCDDLHLVCCFFVLKYFNGWQHISSYRCTCMTTQSTATFHVSFVITVTLIGCLGQEHSIGPCRANPATPWSKPQGAHMGEPAGIHPMT